MTPPVPIYPRVSAGWTVTRTHSPPCARSAASCPRMMCMFGFNAGGGSYLPRQGSFLIQPNETFFGLTGPGVVKSVLGEDVTPDELGGPGVSTARAA